MLQASTHRLVAVVAAATVGTSGMPAPARAAPAGTAAVCPAAGTGRPSVPAGTGSARGATFASFPLTDRTIARVDVGSGNLLLESTDLVLPGIGGDVAL